MPKDRLSIHNVLVDILGSDKVYYQPPESVKMVYPCIVYEHSYDLTKHADDLPYKIDSIYTVTSISKDPESEVPSKIGALRGSSFERHFVSENLHHYIYRVRFIEE